MSRLEGAKSLGKIDLVTMSRLQPPGDAVHASFIIHPSIIQCIAFVISPEYDFQLRKVAQRCAIFTPPAKDFFS
jgi:hypothetical protein